MKRECEFIALTRDSTESDLKQARMILQLISAIASIYFAQRREIRNGTAYFVDLAPVSAARHGRVLILDGMHRHARKRVHAAKAGCPM